MRRWRDANRDHYTKMMREYWADLPEAQKQVYRDRRNAKRKELRLAKQEAQNEDSNSND